MSPEGTVQVFLSYSSKDEDLRHRLETHLAVLKREKRVEIWHDRLISGGTDRDAEVQARLAAADLFLLLVSADFLASNPRWRSVVTYAVERHEAGSARVIPIILRPCDWRETPFRALQALPRGGHAVTSREDTDQALLEVALGIREMLGEFHPVRYPDESTRILSEALDEAYQRQEEVLKRGKGTAGVDEEILELRRKIREGGQLKAGDRLLDGRFKLLESIGRGGFATVWKALDCKRRKLHLVAIKVLHGQYAHDRTRRERFFRGARQMARLRHPRIAGIVEEECEDAGYHFFVMEYVPGGDLHRAVLDRRLSFQEKVEAVLDVGKALQYAHGHDLIHRDVKPGNILLDGTKRPKLTDFDLVRALDTTGGTRTGMLGTVVYAAPEAMELAKEAGIPADVYGLAMTFAFALHGADLPVKVLRDAPRFVSQLHVSAALRKVLARAVAWEPNGRFGSVEAFCRALRQSLILSHLPIVLLTPRGEVTLFDRRPLSPKSDLLSPRKIKVLGIGGGGSNAVDRLIAAGFQGVDFISVNTDLAALRRSDAPMKLQLGTSLTRGLGGFGDPELGRKSALEDTERIREILDGADIVFVVTGLGGGTGTGASPIIAALAGEIGALTVAVVTKPFSFEGRRRNKFAEHGIKELRGVVDTLITIPNERLLSFVDRGTPLTEAFLIADDLLRQVVQEISDLITVPGDVEIVFDDVKSLMTGKGDTFLGIGNAKGENRAREAAQRAISSPLQEISIKGASAVLLNVSGGADITVDEVSEAARIVVEAVDYPANIISGMAIDEEMGDQMTVTVIAAGFDRM